MNCGSCGHQLEPHNKFCGECGVPASGRPGNKVDTGGGNVYGGLYQAGRDAVVNPAPVVPPLARYEVIPKWRSPFTQGVLSWAGLLVGLMSLFPLWKFFESVLELIRSGFAGVRIDRHAGIGWVICFVVLFLMLVVILGLRRLAKQQLRKPLISGWAVSGRGHRITLERIRTGKCPLCGDTMRYYKKPTKWVDHIGVNGRKRREVTERSPALECKRNPSHWTKVDPAEELAS